MLSKRIVITSSIICLLALGLGFWLGGRERWEIAGLSAELADKDASITLLEEQLKAEPDSVVFNYNLAYFYYKSGRFEEGRDLLKKTVESEELTNALVKKVFYNMGNSLFRLAENETDLEQAIKLLSESLRHYRSVIEIEKHEQTYSGQDANIDEDTIVNYTIVQKRIKILADKLAKRKQDAEQQKGIYQLVKELLAEERKIHDRLAELQQKEKAGVESKERDELLKRRAENRSKLQTIKEKIQQEFGAKAKPSGIQSPGQLKSI